MENLLDRVAKDCVNLSYYRWVKNAGFNFSPA
jgi:hypothetical protein